ncbi:MAG TPA: DUF4185 domain-containing protein [Pirellulales bacterium]|nr:DUF4185 domain-containing protein [Pirellulales bacterium]
MCSLLTGLYAPIGADEPCLVRVVGTEDAGEWNARFAGNAGWIGGDGVYSTKLDADRVLFLFGDTLIGKVNGGRRAGAAMINNTVGILPLNPPDAPIRFVNRSTDEGRPAAIFNPGEVGGWFWPQAAIAQQGRLIVFLAHIEKTDQPGAFGFKQVGQWLAVIDNPLDDPEKWNIRQQPIPFADFHDTRQRVWGTAVLVEDEFAYIFGIEDHRWAGAKELIVARAPIGQLFGFDAWRFFGGADWLEQPSPAGLARGLANEFSVSRLSEGQGYILVYTENGLSDRILGRTATAPWGPWSDPIVLYTCPEMAGDKGVFSYAAKAHPWADEAGQLLVSYCVNSWQFARLFEDNDIYRPRFVRVKLAAVK